MGGGAPGRWTGPHSQPGGSRPRKRPRSATHTCHRVSVMDSLWLFSHPPPTIHSDPLEVEDGRNWFFDIIPQKPHFMALETGLKVLTWHPVLAELLFCVRSWGPVRLPRRRTPIFKVTWGGSGGSPDHVSIWPGSSCSTLRPCPKCGQAVTSPYFFLCLYRGPTSSPSIALRAVG